MIFSYFFLWIIFLFNSLFVKCKNERRIKNILFEIMDENNIWIEGTLKIFNEKDKKIYYLSFDYKYFSFLSNLCEYLGFDSLHFQFDTKNNRKREFYAKLSKTSSCCSL